MTKRLFLFAGYDSKNELDSSVIYYISALSKLGDVIVFFDNDIPKSKLAKLKPHVLFADAKKHGEYDFGSYKRAYMYAKNKKILNKYDFMYLVNDSVYGPLYNLKPILSDLKSRNLDAFGIVKNPHREHPHIQSWFVGLSRTVFLTDWFDAFMKSVTHQIDKGSVTKLYEQGLTRIIAAHNLKWDCMYTISGRGVYNKIKKLYRAKMPFMKKNAFPRRGGALGKQILYVLNHVPTKMRNAILENARRIWGDEYISWLLTKNPIKIAYRNIKYFWHKIRTEGL